MASPKTFIIKETLTELKQLLKKVSPFIAPRLRTLIEFKKHEETGISKRYVAGIVCANHNSVQKWRSLYIRYGINALLTHNKTGFKPSKFTKEEHQIIMTRLNDPENGLRGYVELLEWVEKEFNKQIKYNTLLKYCKRNFGSKVKVARKSHIRKDPQAVETFKKTSVKSVKKSTKLKQNNTKR